MVVCVWGGGSAAREEREKDRLHLLLGTPPSSESHHRKAYPHIVSLHMVSWGHEGVSIGLRWGNIFFCVFHPSLFLGKELVSIITLKNNRRLAPLGLELQTLCECQEGSLGPLEEQ